MAIEVVELTLPWSMEPGAPMPVLTSNGNSHLSVSYWEEDSDCQRRVFLRFPSCQQFTFGYPNDEALSGHPLYAFGLRYYGLFEVHGSDWERRLRIQNQVSFPRSDLECPSVLRHFIVAFHDETLEALARGVEGVLVESNISPKDDTKTDWTSF
jgi:hypothetical protein